MLNFILYELIKLQYIIGSKGISTKPKIESMEIKREWKKGGKNGAVKLK